MSSIFDSVDNATAKRKNTILTVKQANKIFGVNDAETSVKASSTDNHSNAVFQSTHLQHSLLPAALFEKHDIYRIFPPSKIIQLSWGICVLCLFMPFFTFIFKAMTCSICQVENIQTLPYDCNRFYLGLFVTLPGISVYIFCCALYFYKKCKLAIFFCVLSTFIFVFSIENSCMHNPYFTNDFMFYFFCLGIIIGIISQYIFFCNSSPTEFTKLVFFCNIGLSSLLLLVTFITNIIFIFIPSSRQYFIFLYTRIFPITCTFILHILSTFYTLLPIELVVTNLILN